MFLLASVILYFAFTLLAECHILTVLSVIKSNLIYKRKSKLTVDNAASNQVNQYQCSLDL